MNQTKIPIFNSQPCNIFLDNEKFSQLQTALVSFKIIQGSYQTYTTKITPKHQNQWKHIIFFPGTALKFPNHSNSQNTAKSILSIFSLKNIPAKIYPVSHRMNPIFPEATADTLEILEILIKKNQIKSVYLITWSAGCCHLEPALELLKKFQCKVQKLVMVSPVVDMNDRPRGQTNDFLNQDFFEFVQKVYCGQDSSKIQQLSLTKCLQNADENNCFLAVPLSIVYGSLEFIKKDIDGFIEDLNRRKKHLGIREVDAKCFDGEDHRMFCFLTTKETIANNMAMKRITETKWAVSKHIVDYLTQVQLLNESSKTSNINPESLS